MGEKQKNCCCECSNALPLEDVRVLAADYKDREGSLIQVLHLAQGMCGCLPLEVQQVIAEELGLTLSHVSGVVSFYSFFSAEPRGRHIIRVCLGTACYVRGGKQVFQKLTELLDVAVGGTTEDGIFSLEVARCFGACGLAPVMAIDDKVYKKVHPDKLRQILAKYYSEEGDAQ